MLVRPEGGAEFVDLVGVAEEEVQEVLRPGAEVRLPSGAQTVRPAFSKTAPLPGSVMFPWPVTVSVAELKSPGTPRVSVMLDVCE